MRYRVDVEGTTCESYEEIEADSFEQAEEIAKDRFFSDHGYYGEVWAEAEELEE